MTVRSLSITFTCLIVFVAINTGTTASNLGVEHKVTEEDAKAAARTLTPELMVGIGCKNCSSSDLAYCASPDAISDHCCCDRKFHEVFPYVPHTCYVRPHSRPLCRTVVAHCGDFARLVLCCCHRVLADKWKNIANASEMRFSGLITFGCVIISLLVPLL
ncbi:uncharacterized protein [Bemisia tabaci]|uniref:uncharacterized protein n=1 Tax=Bemisia tabaci TaxID=7038 RepID=UPI003B283FB4